MQNIKEPPTVIFRQPATANLMVDSVDRTSSQYGLANSFQISKPNSILNGFFNRIGTTELVLEWQTPNIATVFRNNGLTIDVSGAGTDTGTISFPDNLPAGFYTTEQVLQYLVAGMNAACATAPIAPTLPVFTVVPGSGADRALIVTTRDVWVRFPDPVGLSGLPSIVSQFGIPTTQWILFTTAADYGISEIPDLRAFRYLDFISAQLTYNQDLKDSSTAPIVRDVLARWYMAYDNYTAVDGLGFPILMGYEPFTLRRTFSPPKQIRWDNIQPVGNLAFEVYGDNGAICPMTPSTQWLMTLQISEN